MSDHNDPMYLVIPTEGIVTPINNYAMGSAEYEEGLNGQGGSTNGLINGVQHFPGTAMPGQKGNSFIYGHSSDYAYKQGMYNTIFRTLPQVDAGEEVWAYVRQADGSYKRFVYRVSQSYKTDKYDTGTLLPGNGKSMTLSTCVPIGSDAERWIVRAELVGGETSAVDMSYGLDFSTRQQIDRALADFTRT